MLICIVSALNKPIKERALDSLAAVLYIEIEPTLGKRVLDVGHNLFLNGSFVMSNVFAHQLPKLL